MRAAGQSSRATRPDHGHRPRRNDLGRRVHPSERLLDNDRTHGRPALKELNGIIDGDRYFLSDRIRTLKAIRSKIRPEPAPTPLPPRRSVMRRRGIDPRADAAIGAK